MPTFILHSLRSFFGMPIPERREAIDAYHFYRLLQRSQQSFLFYSQFIGADEVDKSSYVRQLLYNPDIQVQEVFIHDKITKSDRVEPIIIDKKTIGEDWQKLINEFNGMLLSHAALVSYIQCPLKYYFERVKHLTDAKLFPDDEIEAKMGDFFHEAIKKLFENYDIIEPQHLDDIKKNISTVVDNLISNSFDLTWMQVLLMKEQLKSWLYKFIDIEKAEISHFPAKIILLEQELNTDIKISEKKLLLFGIADLIIERDDAIYIIDFKTGSEKNVSFDKIEDLFKQNAKLVYAFQLAFYGYLYRVNRKSEKPLYLENIYIKKYDTPFKKILSKLELKEDDKGNTKTSYKQLNFDENIVDEFETCLKDKINELLDENIPFTQTTDNKNCEYCNFNLICKKN